MEWNVYVPQIGLGRCVMFLSAMAARGVGLMEDAQLISGAMPPPPPDLFPCPILATYVMHTNYNIAT